VRIGVPTGPAREVIAVPRDALVLRRAGASVFRVVDKSTAERVEISTGIASGNLIEVIGDLKAGEKVVVRGGERLRPGMPVNIIGGG
jgi:multidrug efflux pump subunit AcrA (membrane-fusion protein)